MTDTQILCYFSLGMCILSLWIRKTVWLWGSFLTISLILAVGSGIAKPFSLIPIAILFLIHFLLRKAVSGKEHLILALLAFLISTGIVFHIFPGFSSWNVTEKFAIRYDKPFIGLFVLALSLPLLKTRKEWVGVGVKTLIGTTLGLGAMIFLALSAGAVCFEPKLPSHILLRLAVNLFFVVIPEEAFFRGFIQEEFSKFLGYGFWARIGSIAITAFLFMLAHIGWANAYAVLSFVFIAGIFYGAIYQYTRAIESSIFAHFALNVTHMVFFTYHAS